MRRELNLELQLGRRVVDSSGVFLGRIGEFEAEGDAITCLLVGKEAAIERLWGFHRLWTRWTGYRIRWDQINWSELGILHTRCPREELERI
jgi:hypothetical protein